MKSNLSRLERSSKPRKNKNNAVMPVGVILLVLALTIIVYSIQIIFNLSPFISHRSLGASAPTPSNIIRLVV